jgi:hypothetical protein
MGLDRTIHLPGSAALEWEAIRSQLARVGENAAIRMIDGLPAFPDEIPEPTWKELRLGLAAGMVTLRRSPGRMSCVIWGNADAALIAAWNKVIWACAASSGGAIETPEGLRSPAEFAAANDIRPS